MGGKLALAAVLTTLGLAIHAMYPLLLEFITKFN